MNNKNFLIKQGNNVFIIEIDGNFYLLVLKRASQLPVNINDFPTFMSGYSFSIKMQGVAQSEFTLTSNDNDALGDNFGNIYTPIIDLN